MTSATALLVLPLVVFTGIDRGWFGGDSGGTPAGAVRVELSNWAVTPARRELAAGPVTFDVVHVEEDHGHGHDEPGKTHDLVVSRKAADGSYEVVARTRALGIGERQDLELNLTPGEYQLSCDVVEEVGGKTVAHTLEGMVTTLTVK